MLVVKLISKGEQDTASPLVGDTDEVSVIWPMNEFD